MSENIMQIIDLRGQNLSRAELLTAMPRAAVGISETTDLVHPVLDDVKGRGVAALRSFEKKFDHIRLKNPRVPVGAIKDALATLDPGVRVAIKESVRRIHTVAANQVSKGFYTDLAEGAHMTRYRTLIQHVDLYVPGGRAVYPSSVIMSAISAQATGIESLAIATLPACDNEEGLPNETTLATYTTFSIDKVYTIGGIQAIATFAYGAKGSEPQSGNILRDPVNRITDPGNIFVAIAKSLVSVFVGIDAVASPTEISIIADEATSPGLLTVDLIGQVEHDELVGSVLFVDPTEIADRVQESLKYRVPRTEHAEHVHTSLSGTQSAIVLTNGLNQSIDVANAHITEHLETQTKDADAAIKHVRSAGAIFRGPYSPVPLDDYMSGFNYVLPTSGIARFAVGLGVHTFMKLAEVVEYDKEGLKTLAARINAFAISEDLPARGECVLFRFAKDLYNKTTLREQEKEAGLR